MKFCTDNVKDIDKYFRGTFVKFMGMRGVFSDGTDCAPAEELVHSIDTIQSNSIKGKRLEGEEVVPYTFMLYAEDQAPAPEVEFVLPRKSYFNTEFGACLLQRIPARQYRRGICQDNTSIQLLKGNGTFSEQGVGLKLLDMYVRKPQPFTFAPREVSYAVSRRVAVAGSKLMVDTLEVGTINYNMKVVHVLPIFVPELKAIVTQLGQADWTVELPPKKSYAGKGKTAPKAAVNEELEF